MTGQFNDTLVGSLRRENEEVNARLAQLREDIRKERHEINAMFDNVREILMDAIANEEDASTVIEEVADALGIYLTKEITVEVPVTFTLSMTVPANCNVDELEFSDPDIECYNSDVENCYVDSFEIGFVTEV